MLQKQKMRKFLIILKYFILQQHMCYFSKKENKRSTEHIKSCALGSHLEYFIIQNVQKYFCFIQIIAGRLLDHWTKTSMKDLTASMFFNLLMIGSSSLIYLDILHDI